MGLAGFEPAAGFRLLSNDNPYTAARAARLLNSWVGKKGDMGELSYTPAL
jgi:hypothetical protein